MVHSDFMHSLLNLQRPQYTRMNFVKGTLITKARNDLVKDLKGDWLLFIDADMKFNTDALNKLLAHNLDIVGGLCFRRVPPFNPTIYKRMEGHMKWQWQENYPKNSLFEVDATGSAFLLIKRKVFESIPYPWYEYKKELSEDLLFCHKAKEAGFKIWIDSNVKIGHLGMMPIDEDYFEKYKQGKKFVQG